MQSPLEPLPNEPIYNEHIERLSPNTGRNPQLDQLEIIAHLMDSAFTIPNTKITFGVDAFIGLLPILGDTISAAISVFLISQAKAMGIPTHKIWLMRSNIFIDWLIGCIPLIGDLFDLGWKANRRNIKIMRSHIEKDTDIIEGEII